MQARGMTEAAKLNNKDSIRMHLVGLRLPDCRHRAAAARSARVRLCHALRSEAWAQAAAPTGAQTIKSTGERQAAAALLASELGARNPEVLTL